MPHGGDRAPAVGATRRQVEKFEGENQKTRRRQHVPRNARIGQGNLPQRVTGVCSGKKYRGKELGTHAGAF